METVRIAVYVLNLENDTARRKAITDQFAAFPAFDVRLLAAVRGGTLPQVVCEQLVRNRDWTKLRGTIGCFLSHVSAWERIAALHAPYAVVLEDDVDVSKIGLLSQVEIPSDAELIFLNDRMSPKGKTPDVPTVVDMMIALRFADIGRTGAGGDGYLLTPTGAEKLLTACKKDSFFGHVDGRLLQYVTSDADLEQLGPDSWIRNVILNHRHPTLRPTLGTLKGYALSSPLIQHRGIESSRDREDAHPANA